MTAPTVARARAKFFEDNGFAADGGYDDDWSEAVFGDVPYRVPNGPARAEALRLHDLHHLVTGYATDWRGESEISAWELGAGGPSTTAYAWVITLWGLFVGLVALPERTLQAFLRGRGSTNLYGAPFDPALLGETTDALSARLRVDAERARGARDGLAFTGWSVLAVAFGVVAGAFTLALAGLGWLRQVSSGCPLRCSGAALA